MINATIGMAESENGSLTVLRKMLYLKFKEFTWNFQKQKARIVA